MGKASRRKGQDRQPRAKAVPFVARPFEGLPSEAHWVALREIVPAATAPITADIDGTSYDVTLATVLPLAWPALHRADGTIMVALQSGTTSSDASRDLAEVLKAAVALEPGQALEHQPPVTADSPRLQDLISTAGELDVQLHDSFEFWMEPDQLDDDTRESLSRANEAIAPTVAMTGADAAYWVRIGARTYLRWILALDEDRATNALARLQAAGQSRLGDGDGADGRLLGAFRAYGLLVPVWEVSPQRSAADYESAMEQLAQRFKTAYDDDAPLTPEERRARAGLVGRQLTLR